MLIKPSAVCRGRRASQNRAEKYFQSIILEWRDVIEGGVCRVEVGPSSDQVPATQATLPRYPRLRIHSGTASRSPSGDGSEIIPSD